MTKRFEKQHTGIRLPSLLLQRFSIVGGVLNGQAGFGEDLAAMMARL